MAKVITYHYPCPDGIFAALAAHLHFKQRSIAPKWVPLTVYRNHTPAELHLQGNEDVFMLDFTGPSGYVEDLAKQAARVVLLDHHKTAAERFVGNATLPRNVEAQWIDMSRSGARIALDYFQPQGLTDEQRLMFDYVQDADLWQWKLPDSKAFHAGLASMRLEYDVNGNADIFNQLLQLRIDAVLEKGRVELQKQQQRIDAALQTAFVVHIGGADGVARGWGNCLAVRADDDSNIRSQLGNALAAASVQRGLLPIGIVAYIEQAMEDSSRIKLSFRGIGDDVDTTVFTSHYNGGGHAKASSCIVPTVDFDGWKT